MMVKKVCVWKYINNIYISIKGGNTEEEESDGEEGLCLEIYK
jgi:hypothetical protein